MRLVSKKKVEGAICTECSKEDIAKFMAGTTADMERLMKSKNGAGLASSQVGIYKRFFIMKQGENIIKCFNPRITFKSPQKSAMKEGCLTYPKQYQNIMRAKTIQAEYENEQNITVSIKLRGLEAKVFQHELDHLNGLTIFYRG